MLGTSVFIREIHVATGAEPENVAAPMVLQNQFEHRGFFPDQLAGDLKYGYGKTRAQVAQVTHHQTQVIALTPDYEQRSDRFGPSHFTLSDDGLSLTCPNNQTTDHRYLTEGKGGLISAFIIHRSSFLIPLAWPEPTFNSRCRPPPSTCAN